MPFEPEEIVQLKSGGPPMTVERSDKEDKSGIVTVFCVWFEKIGNRQDVRKADFNSVLLQKYQPIGPAFSVVRM